MLVMWKWWIMGLKAYWFMVVFNSEFYWVSLRFISRPSVILTLCLWQVTIMLTAVLSFNLALLILVHCLYHIPLRLGIARDKSCEYLCTHVCEFKILQVMRRWCLAISFLLAGKNECCLLLLLPVSWADHRGVYSMFYVSFRCVVSSSWGPDAADRKTWSLSFVYVEC